MSGERDLSLGAALIATARGAIDGAFGRPVAAVRTHPALDRPGATFVTLMRHGELRGCIGSLEARRPLVADVHHNALAAAFGDPRFEPLARHEVEATSVEVSLLSAAAVVEVADEDDLLARLRPGVDGVVLELGARRATFLPQVWDALPDARDFLRALKRKAGMPSDFWSGEIRVSRYTNTKWREDEFGAAPASAEASR